MCTWSPTPTVHATFRRAFPYVAELEQGLLLIGSNEPISIDPDSWKARIAECSQYLGQGITDDCSRAVDGAQPAEPSYPSDFVNTDLFPFDEFN
ncbi:MAG: hypothetical protein JNL58_14070 [Planctomyces sp.]|nr:hypothetical protein [Planctomyces sp.]